VTHDAFLAQLAEVRKMFEAQLPQRIAALQAACEGALAAPDDRAASAAAGQLAHKLAGSSGTFGFPEVGRVAKSLELLFASFSPARPEQIQTLLTTIQTASKLS